MDFAPAFWDMIDGGIRAEMIYSSSIVFDEIIAGEDELADWVRARRHTILNTSPNNQVQQVFREIANRVESSSFYTEPNIRDFLDGADPWVIAQAYVDNTTVVTQEKKAGSNSTRVKVPNICEMYGVIYIDMYQLIRNMGAEFHL